MSDRDRTRRRAVLLVVVLVVGGVAVVTGASSSTAGSDFPSVPGFSVDIPMPQVSFDTGTDPGNRTTPKPGVSPLPVAPDSDRGGGQDETARTEL